MFRKKKKIVSEERGYVIEALNKISCEQCPIRDDHVCDKKSCLMRLAAKELEPKTKAELLERFEKPTKVEWFHHCPNCGAGLPAKHNTDEWCAGCFEWPFCPWCGQALDWKGADK